MLYSPVVSLSLSLLVAISTVLGMIHGMWEGCDWVVGIALSVFFLGFTIDSIVNDK